MLKILGELCSSSKCLHAFPKLHNHPIHSMFLQSQKYLSNSAFLTNIYTLFENRIAIHSNAMSYMVNCNDSVLSLVCGVCKAFVWSYLEASVSLMNLLSSSSLISFPTTFAHTHQTNYNSSAILIPLHPFIKHPNVLRSIR